MEVALLTKYDESGASSRIRTFQYVRRFEEAGIVPMIVPLMPRAYLERLYRGHRASGLAASLMLRGIQRALTLMSSRKFDLVWVEKEAFPYLPYVFESMLLPRGVPLAVDYDDAIFHNYDLHPSPMVRRLLGRKIDRVMERADLVVAGNAYLFERAKQAGAKRIKLIPSVVEPARYGPRKPSGPNDAFVVGWIGTPKTAKYVAQIADVMRSLSKVRRVTLRLVGSGPLDVAGVDVEVLPWSLDTEASAIASFDVGVMPLRDGPWERGKCGYKLIQYMAAGLPVVASAVGANRTIVEHGESGFLVDTADQWSDALATLAQDGALAHAMGSRGRALVEQRFSLDVTAPILIEELRALLGSER